MRISVDWDGTCVEQVWPEEGDWLPGAVEALRALAPHFHIAILSCRVAPVDFNADHVPRDPELVAREINYIERMMLDVGFTHDQFEVWTRPYKPPAVFYIDDRAIPFTGDWGQVLRVVERALAIQGRKT